MLWTYGQITLECYTNLTTTEGLVLRNQIKGLDPDDTFFTADPHLGHKKSLEYCRRPFATVNEMDETLISNWNRKIGHRSVVFVGGDFAFGKPERVAEYAARLNGRKYLVLGNHDHHWASKTKAELVLRQFEGVFDLMHLVVNDNPPQEIMLGHYAMLTWNKSHYGAWQLFGHSHGDLILPFPSRQYDIGVDNCGYAPISYQELKALIGHKPKLSLNDLTFWQRTKLGLHFIFAPYLEKAKNCRR